MSINQTGTIDVISTTPEGKVMLSISDHQSWDKSGHLQMLQDKINMYLHFIESGQLFEDYPDAAGRVLIIALTMKFEPNINGISFLQKAKEIINKS